MNINPKGIAVAFLSAAALLLADISAQTVVPFGKGSIASEPPTYELVQDQWGGWNSKATIMQSKKLYIDEQSPVSIDGLEVPGRPLPTNDWWTDIINSRYSGALWSYPQMLNTSEAGVEICFPTYWADAGKEMKSKSSLTVGASGFRADATIAEDWHDWDIRFRMPDKKGMGTMRVTAAEGMPFTWFEFSALVPQLTFNSRNVDTSVTTPYPSGTRPQELSKGEGYIALKYGDDIYGIYFPTQAKLSISDDGTVSFSKGTQWIVVALLRDASQLSVFEPYAVSIPRDTRVEWDYDSKAGRINSRWNVSAENLRGDTPTAILQGFLPHVWKHALSGHTLHFTGDTYSTPRGTMKMAASASGEYAFSYPFAGMLPAYATPSNKEFNPAIMKALSDKYAAEGTLGADTYWGGKGLTQMALNMTFAKQTGNMEAYELSKKKLRDTFVNWLTYTPGETNYYMCYFRRWGGMLGSAVGYGSDEFNDHHFHFGYFTYAAALLCMEDPEFAADYGDVLRLIAKDYANWDRDDRRFPFMRTFDLWAGHSWAGGLGDGGNDNGNGQESTSEAMQGWGGLYLLGVALGDNAMRDAGIFGWATEARGTREYWFDVDAPRSANAGGRKVWNGKGSREGTYNYDLYPYAYNSNITGKGIGWWTWFGGDPLFMHGIQWMPISPALDYLSWDPDFVAWAYDDMMTGANSDFSHSWFDDTANSADGSNIDALAKNDWGNVALTYLQRTDPAEAAKIFNRAWEEKFHIATSVSTSHISYYTIHNTLSYGLPDTGYHADCPTATVFNRDGVLTYIVYNPDNDDRTVNFYNASGTIVKTVKAPGRTTTVFDRGEPALTSITIASVEGTILPAGSSINLDVAALDQYGARIDSQIAITLSDGAPAAVKNHTLTIDKNAPNGTKFTATAASGSVKASETFTVNPRPVPGNVRIEGARSSVEVGSTLTLSLRSTDQYGTESIAEKAAWTYTTTSGQSGETSSQFSPTHPGMYTVTATSGDLSASADIFVMPKLPNISKNATAVSSSYENGGTATENILDGDKATRWGSDFSDDEWIYIDLGADMYVSRVGILWEASYASEYEIQVASDGCRMTTHTGRYAGEQRTVTVPADWTTVASVSQSQRSDAEVMTSVDARGRYIRMRGRKRALPYGFSIYEMNVYGISDNVGADDLIGIDFALPEAMDEGKTITLKPTAYSRSGKIVATPEITWSADKQADFTSDSFTPRSYGLFTLKATTPTGMTSEASIFVYESRKLTSLSLSDDQVEIIEGETATLSAEGYDRFDCLFNLDSDRLKVNILDEKGEASDGVTYDSNSSTLHGNKKGVYTVRFEYDGISASAKVTVKAFEETNLALGRPAKSSGDEGGNVPENATDGKMDTRWSSAWEENQWISVDLEEAYVINRIVLAWENAFARDYHIEVSLDGNNWSRVYTRTDSEGGTENIILEEETPARYVRLTGDRRALENYGISLHELEVYGTGRYEIPDDGSAPEITYFSLTPGLGSIRLDASADDNGDLISYTVSLKSDGEIIDSREGEFHSGLVMEETFNDLEKGDYEVSVVFTNRYGHSTERTESATVVAGRYDGIEDIFSDHDGEILWYNLDGSLISQPTVPGIYIRRCGNKAEKVLIR